MIQVQTELQVADNTGAKKIECIKVLGGSHRRYARVGDIIKVSVKEAIESFAISSNSNKFFILGEMKELGDKSYLEHQKIIKIAEKLKLKGYTVGNEFKKIKSNTILKHFKDTPDLIKNIKKSPLKDKLILIKGSRSVELEILEKHL